MEFKREGGGGGVARAEEGVLRRLFSFVSWSEAGSGGGVRELHSVTGDVIIDNIIIITTRCVL